MAKSLVIVESPTKARTISRFLGDGYIVEPSVGHIRDLPRSAKDVPAAAKSKSWARLGVDVENGFKPLYIVPAEKREQVKKLKALVSDASVVYLATDEDREGESIAWHLVEVLKPKTPAQRMVFHEITESAIREALSSTREIDQRLVDAQEARRILDRLYGYEVSPVLWKKVMPRLSAGRVQSVACRLLVDRERERISFVSASYADLVAELRAADSNAFQGRLVRLGPFRIAQGRDFDAAGELTSKRAKITLLQLDRESAELAADALRGSEFAVSSVEEKPFKRSPSPPFMTSTLQQEAGRKLRFSSSRTMSAAQRLYERGFITYMRTDSMSLAQEAVAEARRIIGSRYPRALPKAPRSYRSKVKNAQEAHEAIRPSGQVWRSPEELASSLGGDELKLYALIWQRTLASQMADATGTTVVVEIASPLQSTVPTPQGEVAGGAEAIFEARGRVILARGFLDVYQETLQEGEEEQNLPPLQPGEECALAGIEVEEHSTSAPARFTEASLVKALEERGIGRPSTYAAIITTILDRGYAWKRGQALVPSFVAFAVVQLMERYFTELVDFDFTANLEDVLDQIATGTKEALPYLEEFYAGGSGLHAQVEEKLGEIDARMVNTVEIQTQPGSDPVVVRVGRYGPYVQMGEQTASVPDGLAPDELTAEKALELLAASEVKDRLLGSHAELPVYARNGRYGGYVQLGDGDSKDLKRASLLPGQRIEEIDLAAAVALIELPRVVGVDPDTSQEILAHNGRFGPYLSRGRETRSLDKPEEIFNVSLEEARARFSEPKRRGRRAASMEIGVDSESGAKLTLRSGRFGPYLTDGKVNASLPKGVNPEEVTIELALDILAERRARLADDRAG